MPIPSADLELDHFFIGVSDPKLAQAWLEAYGFAFGRPRSHAGQGTTGHFVFFDNAYMELLSADSKEELSSDGVRPLGLFERIHGHQTQACPFGIALRPLVLDQWTISTWPYAAPYLPAGISFPIVTPPGSFSEPLVFISPHGKRPSENFERPGIILKHGSGRHLVTGVTLEFPLGVQFASEVSTALSSAGIQVRAGKSYRLEVVLDGGTSAKRFNFDPILPLSIAL